MPQTDRDYALRAARLLGVELCLPRRNSPGIFGTDWTRKTPQGIHPSPVDASTWKQARQQLDAYARALRDLRDYS